MCWLVCGRQGIHCSCGCGLSALLQQRLPRGSQHGSRRRLGRGRPVDKGLLLLRKALHRGPQLRHQVLGDASPPLLLQQVQSPGHDHGGVAAPCQEARLAVQAQEPNAVSVFGEREVLAGAAWAVRAGLHRGRRRWEWQEELQLREQACEDASRPVEEVDVPEARRQHQRCVLRAEGQEEVRRDQQQVQARGGKDPRVPGQQGLQQDLRGRGVAEEAREIGRVAARNPVVQYGD
mmetsp:Transcript_15956/g.45615  ORF Transcript_15956/g.45615 Transcript_15956/m.45615 type:complete len:234 (+) Transcript_15956:110-811(+)